jgi:myo-inositol-hexaphosphate 3-phosphohydrolase
MLAAVDESDGSEVFTAPLGARLPGGLFVAMSDLGHRFAFYR